MSQPVTEAAGFDSRMMAVALAMARRGLGQTAPNPSVGAVIANEVTGELIARGVTMPGGRPHAETVALEHAAARAAGATLYVTLEPCSHHGRTLPCTDAIIRSGIARVVAGVVDPDPRVGGRGFDALRRAGIIVDIGVMALDAHAVTLGHIVRVAERRPAVTIKIAVGPDGLIARGGAGQPRWVTAGPARALGHMLRARHDAILIGAGTLVDDDPELTCRLPGLALRSPAAVVLAGRNRLPDTAKLFAAANVQRPILVYASDAGIFPSRINHYVTAVTVARIGNGLWLPAVLEDLAARGITRLLVEGGPATWRAFADAGLADEIWLFAAETERPNTARALAIAQHYLGTLPLTPLECRRIGDDTLWRLQRDDRTKPKLAPSFTKQPNEV